MQQLHFVAITADEEEAVAKIACAGKIDNDDNEGITTTTTTTAAT